jgi:hypothetical protein
VRKGFFHVIMARKALSKRLAEERYSRALSSLFLLPASVAKSLKISRPLCYTKDVHNFLRKRSLMLGPRKGRPGSALLRSPASERLLNFNRLTFLAFAASGARFVLIDDTEDCAQVCAQAVSRVQNGQVPRPCELRGSQRSRSTLDAHRNSPQA